MIPTHLVYNSAGRHVMDCVVIDTQVWFRSADRASWRPSAYQNMPLADVVHCWGNGSWRLERVSKCLRRALPPARAGGAR